MFSSESAAAKRIPAADRKIPGARNSHRGENSSMKRKWRQPSRHGFKCGGRERPSLCSVIGTSAIFNFLNVDLMTISEANSMPVVCKSIFTRESLVNARNPA